MAPLKLNFSGTSFVRDAFGAQPMMFARTEAKQALSAVLDVIAIETGDPEARSAWQLAQLGNLLQHASERSEFWRKRIGHSQAREVPLSALPIQTRGDLTCQVTTEGALIRREDGLRTKRHSTSGSSGVPVEFFVTEMNGQYNQVRSYAQYFIEGRDLWTNRTRVKYMTYEKAQALGFDARGGLTVQVTDNWLGPLGKLFKSGSNKLIQYWRPNPEHMLEELSKHAIGYLSVNPDYVDELFADNDVDFLKDHGADLIITIGNGISAGLRAKCDAAAIGVRGGYSAEETGLIAAECAQMPSRYHVAQSNVIVELDRANSVTVGGRTLSPVLVTALHSYATPIVRYDVGDLAAMDDSCPCGHAGPTLCDIVGRSKNLIKHPDGRLSFVLFRPPMLQAIAPFNEYRIRQTGVTEIVLELAGCKDLTLAQRGEFAALIRAHAGGDFNVDVRTAAAIDWGRNQKRLGFVNELL